MFWSIKCIHNIEYKMYLQNEKMADCEFLSIFLTKEGLNKYITLLCKMELWDGLQKEDVVVKWSLKMVFLKISQNLQENTFVGVFFLIKLQASGLKLYQKRDSNTGVFLWILWNFLRTLFLKNTKNTFFKEHVWWLLLYRRFIFVDFL